MEIKRLKHLPICPQMQRQRRLKQQQKLQRRPKKAFEQSVSWIDDRKYYNQLSLKEELAAWERVQKRYSKGTDERKKADREVYRVQQELIKEKEKILKDEFDNSSKWIDERKHYNELGLQEELAAGERVQKRYLEGTEERKKADREVYRVKQELIKTEDERVKNWLDNINESAKKKYKEDYDNAVEVINDKKYYNQLSLNDELTTWKEIQKKYSVGTNERKNADKESLQTRTGNQQGQYRL